VPIRTTVTDAARRAQSNASRATLREADDDHLWQEMKALDVTHSETHTGVERAQQYGFTCVPAKQDQEEQQQQQQDQSQGASTGSLGGGGGGTSSSDEADVNDQQPQGDAAEAIIMYLNGSRSHPVVVSVDDRRHRLKGLEEGDVAHYRLKDDRQQIHLHKDGTYISARDDKTIRMAMVPKQQQGQQQQQQQGQQQGNGQQQKKEYGQKSARDDNVQSSMSVELNGQAATMIHGQGHVQATPKHAHIRTGGNRIFTDTDGHWSVEPIMLKKDKHDV